MPSLVVRRTYRDNKTPTSADLDNVRTDIEGFFNTVHLDADNIQWSTILSGLTSSQAETILEQSQIGQMVSSSVTLSTLHSTFDDLVTVSPLSNGTFLMCLSGDIISQGINTVAVPNIGLTVSLRVLLNDVDLGFDLDFQNSVQTSGNNLDLQYRALPISFAIPQDLITTDVVKVQGKVTLGGTVTGRASDALARIDYFDLVKVKES